MPSIEEETEEESGAREERVASAVRTEADTRAMKEVTSLTMNQTMISSWLLSSCSSAMWRRSAARR